MSQADKERTAAKAKNAKPPAAAPAAQPPAKDYAGGLLKSLQGQIIAALPKHLPAAYFARVVLTSIRKNPKLLECKRHTLLGSIMTAAQLGLPPDDALGLGYLVPYKDQCQFIPGYKGYIQLAHNSGEIADIQAKAVRKGDEFDFAFGTDQFLKWRPRAPLSAEITHVWLIVKLVNGGMHMDVFDLERILYHRSFSQGYRRAENNGKKDSPWHKHLAEMGCKSIIRANAKFLPMSVQRAAAIEDVVERGAFAFLGDDGGMVIEGDLAGDGPDAGDDGNTALDRFAKDGGSGQGSGPHTPPSQVGPDRGGAGQSRDAAAGGTPSSSGPAKAQEEGATEARAWRGDKPPPEPKDGDTWEDTRTDPPTLWRWDAREDAWLDMKAIAAAEAEAKAEKDAAPAAQAEPAEEAKPADPAAPLPATVDDVPRAALKMPFSGVDRFAGAFAARVKQMRNAAELAALERDNAQSVQYARGKSDKAITKIEEALAARYEFFRAPPE